MEKANVNSYLHVLVSLCGLLVCCPEGPYEKTSPIHITDPSFLSDAAAAALDRSRGYRTSAAAAPLNSFITMSSEADDDRHADDAAEPSRRLRAFGGSGKRQDKVLSFFSLHCGCPIIGLHMPLIMSVRAGWPPPSTRSPHFTCHHPSLSVPQLLSHVPLPAARSRITAHTHPFLSYPLPSTLPSSAQLK